MRNAHPSARPRIAGRMSLSLVILLSSLLIVAVLMLMLAGVLVPRVSRMLEQNAVERATETALESTRGLELYIDNVISTLHFTSTLVSEMGDIEAADFSRIDLMKDSQADIVNIALFSNGGDVLYATSESAGVSTELITESDWFKKAIEWEGAVPHFEKPRVQMLFKDQHRWVITLSRAVEYLENGELKTGVLMLDYNYTAVSKLIEDMRFGSSGYAYIINSDDDVICHPKLQLLYAGIATENTAAASRQVTGVCRDEGSGRGRILVINTISQTRWRMVSVAYLDEILSLQNTFLRMFSIALVCGGLLSLSAASAIAYYVTRPIRYLESHMRKVESGDLTVSIEEQGFQEIRSLSMAFNHMLERIRQLMRQIVAEQEAKRLHELNALQAQINPHFLYNTLDSIIWMEERNRSEEAIEMVSALAKLFRISISKGKNIITVREELEHVRNYLIIQQTRFRNKFVYEITAEEAVLNLNTVKLIIQPLVENAVHHGIYSYDEKLLTITVDARREGDKLVIAVKDDGVGIPDKILDNILTASNGKSGIGLRNVHERIQLTCGRKYGLSVSSAEDEGTSVTITLPADLGQLTVDS